MARVPQRPVSTNGPSVPVLSLGSAHTYDRMAFPDVVRMLRHAVDSGVNFFDVGFYGGYRDNPRGTTSIGTTTDIIFGRAIEVAAVARDEYQLSLKLWIHIPGAPSLADQLSNLLGRVGTTYTDFVVIGDPHFQYVDVQGLVNSMRPLIEDGRVRRWGVNNWGAGLLRRTCELSQAAGIPGPDMSQLKYSIVRRSQAEGAPYRQLIEDCGISIQASDVLEQGALAGKTELGMGRDPGDIRDKIPIAAAKIREIARQFDATAAQLAIAFCLKNEATSNVLFGASTYDQFLENLGSIAVLQRCGEEIRRAVEDLWLDEHVDPETGHCLRDDPSVIWI
ncbi:MAG: aldo/keto reductase [Acidimicrobiales bacterium]